MNKAFELGEFTAEITEYGLSNYMKPDFADIQISVGLHSITIPNNADTLTKLIVYLQSIVEDVI